MGTGQLLGNPNRLRRSDLRWLRPRLHTLFTLRVQTYFRVVRRQVERKFLNQLVLELLRSDKVYLSATNFPPTPSFFLSIKSTSLVTSAKKLSRLIKSLRFYRRCSFYVHDHTKWDLGRAPCDVTSGTGLKQEALRGFKGCENIFWVIWDSYFIILDKILS